jgi:Protein of unknown function (DUF1573)
MKKLNIFLFALLISAVSYSQGLELEAEPKKESGVPVLGFSEISFDFGEITQGDKVSHTFGFTNEGTVPLVISRVQTTCGCTVPKWPSQPIPPGEKEEIAVTFNSAGKMGVQNKVITIHSNASEPVFRLTLKSNVLKKQVESSDSGN